MILRSVKSKLNLIQIAAKQFRSNLMMEKSLTDSIIVFLLYIPNLVITIVLLPYRLLRAAMKSIVDLAKSNPFSSPFMANCQEDREKLLKVSHVRNIGTAAAAAQAGEVEYGTMKYYLLCSFGGLLSCGLTHTAVVPLDLVKCRIQVDAAKYKSIVNGFRVSVAEEGLLGLTKGWAPTLIGYSIQGVGKFGFYEMFKHVYGNMLGEENSFLWRTSLYLAASASAEFFADIGLAPFEAVKVRIQTQPGWANSLREGMPKLYREEGINGFYKGLAPLWMRQIPYTMMKFACFERTVEALYKFVVPKPREQCTKGEQLTVTFAAGYIAGVFCAVVSHPADTIVSKLNNEKGATALSVVRKVGFAGLWKGLFPRIVMVGTLTALQWFIYDTVKVALNLPRPPPPQMPESLRKKLELENK